MKEYRLIYSETCRNQISALHPEIKSIIRSQLDGLVLLPYAGKRLKKELAAYRSFRARRFRIIYRIDEKNGILEIHYVGHRKDIYELFTELVMSGRDRC